MKLKNIFFILQFLVFLTLFNLGSKQTACACTLNLVKSKFTAFNASKLDSAITPISAKSSDSTTNNTVSAKIERKKFTKGRKIKKDTLRIKSKDGSINSIITYQAKDSSAIDVPGKKIYLY